MSKGILYCVGVGPGDPELLTLKAARIIRECDVLVLAVSGEREHEEECMEKCIAYQIIKPVVPEAEEKEKLFLPMPMIKEKEKLKEIHDQGTKEVAQLLDQGKTLAFITLGDPTIYSSSLYIQKRIKKMGYETAIISGITSFCAAAARLNVGIAENREEIHIIPASYEIEESLELPGTKILMKAGKKVPMLKEKAETKKLKVRMVENCGMETEHVYQQLEDIPDHPGYYSLFIIK